MEGISFKPSHTERLEMIIPLGVTEVRVVCPVITSHQADQSTNPSQLPLAITKVSKPSLVLENPSFVLDLVLVTPVNNGPMQY